MIFGGEVLSKKNVIITGGTGDIGKNLCSSFVENGYNVYFIYHSDEITANSICNKYKDKAKVKSYRCDVSDYHDVESVFGRIISETNRVHVLVNNAGISLDSLIMDMSYETWNKVIEVDLNSVFYCSKQVIPLMLEQQFGSIVNISSIMGSIGWAGLSHYSAAKSGIEAFTRVAAVELGRSNIRVNSVSPGMIKSKMSKNAVDKFGRTVKKITPLKMYGDVSDVSNAVIFLASDKSAYITGENIYVRGGLGSGLSIT